MSTVSQSGSSLLLTMVKWAVENDLFLADFVQRCALPHLALVTKGQYLSIGAPNVANPALKPYVIVHSIHKVKKVLAQLIRVKEGKKKILTEHKVAIPQSYTGYFEILSEDGRPVKCLESVLALCQKFPELCLIRQNCKAYLPDSDGELRNLFRTRTLQEGEVLTLVGQFNFKRTVFLRCFDEQGQSIYLKLSQKGKFSPVARPDAITGVHSVENLMKKRLPLTVKLIQGTYPTTLSKVIGGSPCILQLETVFTEEVAFMYSVHKDQGHISAVPLNAHLKLAPAINHPQIRTRAEFQKLCRKSDSLLAGFFNEMCVFNDHHLVYDSAVLSGSNNASEDIVTGEKSKDRHSAVADEEIDQLYDYIRGLAPLPDSCHHKPRTSSYKPPPPPVETIPSRKSADSLDSQKTENTCPSCREVADKPPASSLSPIAPEQNVQPATPNNRLLAEKRLDDVIYGGNRIGRKKLSKSTEKLSHHQEHHLASCGRANDQDQGKHFADQGRKSNSKPRPLSMVIPDKPVILQRMTAPIPNQEFYPALHGPGFCSPYHHPMYHSFMNLHLKEDPPPAYSTNPSAPRQYPHSQPMAQQPPYPNGFPNVRPVYTRYAPAYHYQPVYRV